MRFSIMEQIRISIKQKDYDGSHNKYFKSFIVLRNDLEDFFKTFNYSLITWTKDETKRQEEYNRGREKATFESASGLVIDIDENLSIRDAQFILDEKEYNYVIITSRNHQKDTMKKGKFSPAQDRYHIVLFFNREVTDPEEYSSAYAFISKLFPEVDESCKSLDRFIFGSPEDAEYYSCSDWQDIDIDRIELRNNDFLNTPIAEKRDLFEFDIERQVRLGSGKVVKIKDITSKQPCHCLRPEHPDRNPSAFIKYDPEKDKWMSYCSGCGYTGWSELTKKEYELNKQMQHFYYLGKDVYEMGIAEEKFFLTKNSEKNFCYTIGADSKKKREAALKNLIKSRRLRTLTRVDYVGNPYISESYYFVSPEDGLINVNIAAVQPIVNDNQFIEDYLERTFGSNKDFIKQYLAMYVYTNHTNLPTLILYGPRGCGKTTFAGLVADIYPTLYHDWSGETSNFSQECEKKLLVIEENLIDEKSQYKTLKKYTGQKFLKVNKKYQPEYMVKNNLNIILISNEQIPLYVEKTEKPNDPSNNQFFVWEFPALNKTIDGTFNQKLKERIGHYIRTELKTVFDNINKNYTRYGIPVPITTYEEQLFENNTTNIEAQADFVLEKIENRYKTFVPDALYPKEDDNELREAYDLYAKGYLPYALVEKFSKGGVNPNAVIKNLKKRKVIEQKVDRRTENKRKFNCYKIIKLP
jgi:DNA polymerase III delta prime subunit